MYKFAKIISPIFLVFILIESAQAVNYTWTGTTSTAFNTTTNWSPNGLPGSADYITIVSATNLPILANNVTVARLTVSSGTLNLNGFTMTVTSRITTTGGAVNNGTLSGTITRASLANATFGAAITITTDTVELNSSIFSSTFTLTYKGTQSINNTTGGNTFNGTTSITQTAASTSILTFGKSFADNFNGLLTISNNCTDGTKWLMIGCKFASTQFNNNVTLNLGNANSCIILGRDSATTTLTLAAGRTISSGTFTAGYVEFRNFLQNGTTAQNFIAPVSGSFGFSNARFGGSVTTTCGAIGCSASVFNGASNIFTHNAPLIASHISSGVFAGTTANTFINNSSGRIDVSEFNWADVTFNGPANFYNNSSGYINIGAGGTVWLNGDTKVYSTGTGDITFIYPTTLAATKTITAPTFSSGSLYLYNFKQLGTQAQNITLTGTAKLYYGVGTVFNGSLTTSSPNLFLNGGTYNGATNSFTQTGTTINSSTGGCTFAGATSNTITNTGTGEVRMATTNPDIFNGPTTFTNSSTGTINVGYSSANNQLNNNVTVNSSAAGTIGFGQSTGTCVLANTRTISAGTFTTGNLRLKNFTQTGTTNQTVYLTGTASLYFETGTTINAQLDCNTPNLYLNGSTFNGASSFIKTSATLNVSTGGNTFNGWLGYISNWGGGEIRLSNVTGDTYSSTTLAVFDNQGTGTTNVAYNAATQFNGNINIHSIANGTIAFSQGSGSATLAVGRTINPSGFTIGNLRLKKFTQLGTAVQTLTTTGTSSIYFETGTTFNATIYCTAPNIYLNGATFNGFSKFTKTAGISNFSTGGNTFNGATEIINNGTGDFTMGTTNPDKFYGVSSTFSNNGSGYFDIAYSSTGNQFSGTNMIVNSTSYGGIWFGFGGGTTTFQYGNIFPGYLGAFIDGAFSLSNFTYLSGSMMQEYWTLTGNAYFQTNNSTYNNVLNITAPSILLNNSNFIYGGTFIRTGNNFDYSQGGNSFQGSAVFDNQSTSGGWYLGTVSGDGFEDDATFQGIGSICPATFGMSTFKKNITTNTSTLFGTSGGSVRVMGNATQLISGSILPSLPTLIVYKTFATQLNLGYNLSITQQLTLQTGNINLNGHELIITNPNASAISYVLGYILSEQTDNSSKLTWQVGTNTGAHVIPFGDASGNQIPFTFDLNSGNAGNVSVSTYGTPANNLPLPTTPTLVTHINDAFGNNNSNNTVDRFWQIDVTGTTANATLTFKASPGEVGSILGMKAQRWNSTSLAWDTPLAGQTSLPDGVIVPNVTQFSPWTLSGNNSPLPIELVSFSASPNNDIVNLNWVTATETNNDFFTVERSADGINFEPIITVDGAGNSFSTLHYSSVDEKPISGVSYYRLKQTDFDGQYSYSNIVAVEFSMPNASITLYPNPTDNGVFYIQSPELNDANLICRITNNLGETVFEKTVFISGATIVELPNKPAAGIYTLTLLSGKTAIAHKLIIR